MAQAQAFHLKIISPSAVIVDGYVRMVEVPGTEGDFGVLPGHSPLFSMIRPGVIKVHNGDGTPRSFFATSGYADVTPETCTVISDRIQDISEISTAEADEALAEARAAIGKAENAAERQQAEMLLRAAEALVTAVKGHHH